MNTIVVTEARAAVAAEESGLLSDALMEESEIVYRHAENEGT